MVRVRLLALLVCSIVAGDGAPLPLGDGARAHAQQPAKRRVQLPGPSDAPRVTKVVRPSTKEPSDYTSEHFLIHTDLVAADARRLLARMEKMLALVSKYWDHPPLGVIECYVVKDLANWPADALDPVGRAKIAQEAGITLVETLNRGRQTVAAKAVVYAYADRGTPLHESVHAYCGQTFGRVGPLWYSEGMAELGQYWQPEDTSVQVPDYLIQYIQSQVRDKGPKPLAEIVAEDGISGDSWQNYAWRWALCHMLENNPNYRDRFRPLGIAFLTDQPVSFADVYGPVMAELAFEYRFFLKHVDNGYRVDLCRWDWDCKFREPEGIVPVVRVAARRGWQASGVLVSPERKYEYVAEGKWRLASDGDDVSADGHAGGAGRLEGVIMSDFQLSEPFPLAASGTFTPATAGQLYLRCRDRWNELSDNRGNMRVSIKHAK